MGRLNPDRIPLLTAATSLALVALLLLTLWNIWDPLPPAWDEAQHLLMAQDFGRHWQQFELTGDWWRVWAHLSQRYPPLTYWLTGSLGSLVDRSGAQLLNLCWLGILSYGTYKVGSLAQDQATGILAGSLVLLYPAVTGLAHVYMLDLPLTVAVTLAYWGCLGWTKSPTWRGSLGVGASLGLVLLSKWNGILFLAVPLLWILGRWTRWGSLKKVGILLAAGAVCGVWYGPNWVFVISNGLQYGATTHYYVECATGSWCWWLTYARWLPGQMSPILCGIPLLGLWMRPRAVDRFPSRFWLVMAFLGGYGLYTLIGIKDPRFSVPLLPLLAVLAAMGLMAWSDRMQRKESRQRWIRIGIPVGLVALLWSGQPLTPGAAPLWSLDRAGQPQRELRDWIQSQAGSLGELVGVIPNTELLSAETLTYLARLEGIPTTFFPAGQVEAREWELILADGYVTDPGLEPAHWGITGPFLPAKQEILATLQTTPDSWIAQDPVTLPSVGSLQIYQRQGQQDSQGSRLEMLEQMAAALREGDFHPFARLLSAWTLLREDPTLLDPEIDAQQLALQTQLDQLEEGNLDQALHLRYQLAVIALARLDGVVAQAQFDQAALLDPNHPWHRAYGSLMRLWLTHDIQDWRQDIRQILDPLIETGILACGRDLDCEILQQWDLLFL